MRRWADGVDGSKDQSGSRHVTRLTVDRGGGIYTCATPNLRSSAISHPPSSHSVERISTSGRRRGTAEPVAAKPMQARQGCSFRHHWRSFCLCRCFRVSQLVGTGVISLGLTIVHVSLAEHVARHHRTPTSSWNAETAAHMSQLTCLRAKPSALRGKSSFGC